MSMPLAGRGGLVCGGVATCLGFDELLHGFLVFTASAWAL